MDLLLDPRHWESGEERDMSSTGTRCSSSTLSGSGLCLLPQSATKIQGKTFRLLLNYKNPKSVKVGYWRTKPGEMADLNFGICGVVCKV